VKIASVCNSQSTERPANLSAPMQIRANYAVPTSLGMVE
jgi:hypothetical protein